MKKLLHLITLLTILTLPFCSPVKPVNIDDFYDYQMTVTFDSLTTKMDTLEIFKEYKIPFGQVGVDTFKTIEILDSTGEKLNGNTSFNFKSSDTVISIYFVKPYTGKITIKAISPNGRSASITSDSILTIINPYKIDVKTTQGEDSENTLWVTTIGNKPDVISTIWTIDTTIDTVLGLSYVYVTGTEDYSLNIKVMDEYLNVIDLGNVDVTVDGTAPKLDTVYLNDTLRLGEKASFKVELEDTCSSYKVFATINGNALFDTGTVFYSDSVINLISENEVSDTGTQDFKVYIVSKNLGLSSNEIEISEEIIFTLPAPKFSDSTISIPKGKNYTINFTDENYRDNTLYTLTGAVDTTIFGKSFTVNLDSTDTLVVFGTDKYGYTGKSDTVIIVPTVYEYTLEKVDFPLELTSGVLSKFVVKVNGLPVTTVEYNWTVENEAECDSVYENNDTLSLIVSDTLEPFKITVFAVVNGTVTTDTIKETISIKAFPEVEFTTDSFPVLLGDTVELTFTKNITVDSVFVSFDDDTVGFEKDTSYKFVPDSLGELEVYIWGTSDSLTSAIDASKVVVFSNNPTFNPATGDTLVFINDEVTITVNADAGNLVSTVDEYYWDLDGDGSWNDTTLVNTNKVTKTASFNDTIIVGCKNSLGDTATEFFKYHLIVTAGEPSIDSVSVDTVWINDDSSYTFYFHDENGYVTSLDIDWGDDSVDSNISILETDSSKTIGHVYSSANDNTFEIIVTVTDEDGQIATDTFSVFVKLGAPTVDSMKVDITDSLYVVDVRTYSVYASDENGFIRKIFVSWNGDEIPEDSIIIVGDSVSVDVSFTHGFDTTESGDQNIAFWVEDEDTVLSEVDSLDITVKLGAPVLSGDDGDTLWVIVDGALGNYPLYANISDANGIIEEYSWSYSSGVENAFSVTDSNNIPYAVNGGTLHNAVEMHIYGKDDDDLLRGGQFVIYPDSVPPVPSVTSDAVTGGRKISWSGKDVKDGDATEYQILCDKNNPPVDTVSVFQAGYDDGGAFDFSFTFTPSEGAGVYNYQVIAKDARDSKSESNISTFGF